MPVLWLKAPFALRRHPSLLFAVILSTALAALAAASLPIVRAGVESESLSGRLQAMSPLAAGLEIRVEGGLIADDARRRAAAVRLARRLPHVGRPVLSSLVNATVAGTNTHVVALARTGALAHVQRETPSSGPGVWIASSTALAAHVRPGGILRLTEQAFLNRVPVVRLRVAGIYRPLEEAPNDPYWANWLQDIRSPHPDNSPPPAFVLTTPATFARVARVLSPRVEDRFELPVDPSALSVNSARDLGRRIASIRRQIDTQAQLGAPLGCVAYPCGTSSSLDAALTTAAAEVAAVKPTVSLLSGCGVLIALALGIATGIFLVRRRDDEAHLLFARGEPALAFAVRSGVESVLPAVAGFAFGAGGALLALQWLAPAGTTDRATTLAAVGYAALAAAGIVVTLVAGVAAAYPRRRYHRPFARRVARIPWEVVPLAGSAVLLSVILGGHGLARDANGANHPRLAIFVLPLIAVPGTAGLATRVGRRLVRARGSAAPAALFLTIRRLTAASGFLFAVVVATATSFGAFAYSAALSASLDRSTAEKAWVGNGSDVQGFVDPHATIVEKFPFPVAVVQVDQADVVLPSGAPVDLIAGDPAALQRTLRWGDGWNDDPRPLLPRLARSAGPSLAAIASPGMPDTTEIVDQGVTIPVEVVGHAAVPGATAGRAALLVSRSALARIGRRLHVLVPSPQTGGLVWAKGPVRRVEAALRRSTLAPFYLTTSAHITNDPSVSAAARSYRFVRVIGIAAAVLSLLALLLYLQGRQRSQLISSALLRRMGFSGVSDAAALACEAAVILLFAALVGSVVAVAVAAPIVSHVDSLPAYAPGAVFVVPWTVLVAGLAAATAAAACLGAAAAAIAARSDASGALRVA